MSYQEILANRNNNIFVNSSLYAHTVLYHWNHWCQKYILSCNYDDILVAQRTDCNLITDCIMIIILRLSTEIWVIKNSKKTQDTNNYLFLHCEFLETCIMQVFDWVFKFLLITSGVVKDGWWSCWRCRASHHLIFCTSTNLYTNLYYITP